MRSLLNLQDRTAVAHALYDADFKPEFSTNVGGHLTAGYGECQGEFEYPLYLIEDKIQKWEDVKGWLRIEEKMDAAIDVINGDVEDVKGDDYILFNGEVYKAHKQEWMHGVTGEPVEVFEFYSPDGKQQLQTDTGYWKMPLRDWHLFFASDGVEVCDTEVDDE